MLLLPAFTPDAIGRLEAQTRAKVSRVKSDMRTTALALEAYSVDYNSAVPQCHPFGIAGSEFGWDSSNPARPALNRAPVLERLSTPVAYVTQASIRDPFNVDYRQSAATAIDLMASDPLPVPDSDAAGRLNSYIYQSWGIFGTEGYRAEINSTIKGKQWVLHSAGPDSTYHNLGGVLSADRTIDGPINMMYDPTNGTVSAGSVYRTGGEKLAPAQTYACGAGLVSAIQVTQ